MASSLGNNLVDDLLSVIDDLRGDLLPAFGVRQYTVKLVTKTWSGVERGDGDATLTKVTISPVPLVEVGEPDGKGLRYELQPQGRTDEAIIKVSEISLYNYQEADLTGGTIAPNVEFYWEVTEAQGQAISTRTYVLAGPPVPDRIKTLGWIVYLRRAEEG